MDRKPLQLTRADLRVIAQMISNKVIGETTRLMDKNFLRGEIVTISGCLADVLIEGDSIVTPGLVSLDSYNPVVGDKILLGNIGSMGINKVILGNMDCSLRHKVGTFMSGGGDQVITGIGFKPRLVRFEYLGSNITTRAQHGGGTMDGTNQWAYWITTDGAATVSAFITNGCIVRKNIANNLLDQAAFVSFDGDGFTINWSTVSSELWGYEAFG